MPVPADWRWGFAIRFDRSTRADAIPHVASEPAFAYVNGGKMENVR